MDELGGGSVVDVGGGDDGGGEDGGGGLDGGEDGGGDDGGGVPLESDGGATVTVAAPELSFPEKSLAVNVTAVAPTGKNPGASFVIAGAGSTTSLALAPARKAAIAGSVASTPAADDAWTLMLAGNVSCGGVVSWTVTVNEPLAPTDGGVVSSSTTWHVTVVVPKGKRALTLSVPLADEPPGPSQVTDSGLPCGFVAVTVYVTVAPSALSASATIEPGKVNVGAAAAEPAKRTAANPTKPSSNRA